MTHWVQDLVDRRVPQLLAVYLGASWVAVEFVSFLEERYLLSPHLTDATLLGLALLIPSVVMVTYNHGQKGPDRWLRTEKVGVPVNIFGAVTVLFIVFSGKPLGAVTTTVALEDEEGHTVERVVPRSEFRKRVALFDLEWVGSGEEDRWLGTGASLALSLDLDQDLFVQVRDAAFFVERLREEGVGTGGAVPLTLRMDIARTHHLPYLAGGTISREGDELLMTIELHDTERGRLLVERTYRGPDLFALVDEASVQLKRDLEVPEGHVEGVRDLPAEEILTASREAYRDLTVGYIRLAYQNDWQGAAESVQLAVEADPGFALAWYLLFQVHLFSNRVPEATAAIESAMEQLYKIPERLQFQVKSDYYFVRRDPEKAYAVLDMWVELYPEDVRAHEVRAQIQSLRSERAEAIASYRRILELDPGRLDLLRSIGALQEASGDFEAALATFQRYAEAFPDDWQAYVSVAGLHRARGEHEEARAAYERALLLDPGNVPVMVSLATLEHGVGRFDEALALLEEALRAADSPEERAEALAGFTQYHRFRGEVVQGLDYLERSLEEKERFQPPFLVLVQRMVTLGAYVDAGRAVEARRRLDAYAARLTAPMDLMVPVGYVEYHLQVEDPDGLEEALAQAEQAVAALGYESLRPILVYATGRMHELRGEYDAALESYRRELELSPADAKIHGQIGRCERELGRLAEAERAIRRTLEVIPAHGRYRYELALVYERMGEPERALEQLDRALLTWQDADPVYVAAREAREKRAELAAMVAP